MKFIVCVKQVPDTSGKVAVKADGTMDRSSMAAITNPDDRNAVEAALTLKDQHPEARVVVISMGPPPAAGMLRELLAMGCDEAVLISGREFGGSDTFATSQIIAAAIAHLGLDEEDVIFCGRQAIDGDTAQVGPQIAEHLNIPNVSYAEDIQVEGDTVTVKRQYEDRYHTVKVKMPCLITALSELNQPRYMTPGGIFDAYREKTVTVWTVNDIEVDMDKIGLKGSPTRVFQSFPKSLKAAGTVVTLDGEEAADYMLEKLREKFII